MGTLDTTLYGEPIKFLNIFEEVLRILVVILKFVATVSPAAIFPHYLCPTRQISHDVWTSKTIRDRYKIHTRDAITISLLGNHFVM